MFTIQSTKRFCVLIAALFSVFSLQASEPDKSEFQLKEIAEGIYVHEGVHVSFSHPQHDDIANIGFIVGEKCIAVIDTSGSVKTATAFKNAIRTISDKPICYVINTHVHFDHVLGNVVFKEEGVEFIGHVNLFEAIPANREFFISEFKQDLDEHANEAGIIAPTMLVEDELDIDLGDRVLQLKAYPTAHSNTDLTVYDEQTNTIWLSDLLFIHRIPALDGSLKGWLKVMDEYLTQDYKTIIPGHGPVTTSLADVEKQKDYLQLLLSVIREKINAGAFMEEIVDEVGKDEKTKWLLHEQHHKRNVTKAFAELEWE